MTPTNSLILLQYFYAASFLIKGNVGLIVVVAIVVEF
jgi:hypothetical protein